MKLAKCEWAGNEANSSCTMESDVWAQDYNYKVRTPVHLNSQNIYRTWMVKPLSECCVNIMVTEGIPTTSVTPDYISEITHWNEAS